MCKYLSYDIIRISSNKNKVKTITYIKLLKF